MVRAGFPGWKTSRKKEGAACSSRQLRTVVVSIPAGGEGWAGWVVISLHRKGEGKKFGGLSCCVLSFCGGSEGISSCVPSAVVFAS